ncbi:MAG: DUF2807 domain-containing protein, partial [Acidobacteriota bacterium]
VDISGSGDFSGEQLHTEKAAVVINGSGDTDVYVTEELSAAVNGSGDINYYGNPKVIDQKISGSGSINRK